MKLILFLLKQSKGTFVLATLIGAIGGLGNAGFLAIINSAISEKRFSGAIAWSFFGLCLLLPITRIVALHLTMRLGQTAVQEMRVKLSERILSSPLRQIEDLGTHRLLMALTDDIGAVSNTIVLVPMACINVAVVLGSLAYLGWLSWTLLLVALGLMVIGVISYQLPILAGVKRLQQAREERDELFKYFRALTDGAKELKLHQDRRKDFVSHLAEIAASLRELNISSQTIFNAAASWGQVLVFALIGVLLALSSGTERVSSEALLGAVLIFLYMMTPLQIILNSLPELGRAGVAVRKAEKLGISLVEKRSEEAPAPPQIPEPWRSLELRDVVHAYRREGEDHDFTLGPINLSAEPGELIFVIGGNGSGKTTLAKILTGLYMPGQGDIFFNGTPVDDSNREAYRQHFSVVFSDFYLFDKLFGLTFPETDEKAREYLELLELSHKLEIRDGELSTTALSQGQRKRLALLISYLEDRPIYLFDEWAADQDPEFKKVFYYQLLPDLKRRGKLVFVISHDDRYYSVADRVIKLDYGKIDVEVETPREDTTHRGGESGLSDARIPLEGTLT